MSVTSKSESATAAMSLENRIDLVCDAFEQQWRDGERPSISAYLQQVPQPEQAALFSELLLVDLEFRSRAGDPAGKQNYLANFPEFAGQIETVGFKYGLDDTQGAESSAQVVGMPVRRRVAHFELIERIGVGGFGEVWKARDEKLQRTVAVKIPLQSELTEPELDRFLRESKASAQLRHPRIVSIHEVGRDRATAYIVSDYVAGGNLRNLLDRARPTPREAAELCRQLAEGIHHAHEQKVVHRDLKPTNVLIDENGQPYIADFGLAKWSDDGRERTLDGQLLGTPAYMSPEQARGEGNRADRRCDVYALGVLLYEMLTGKCPFQGDHAAIVHQVVHEEPPLPRSLDRTIPRDLETICLKAMAKDRERRYPSAQEMAVDLARYLRGDAILARRSGLLEKSWRVIRRHKGVAAAVACGFVALGALGMVNQLQREKHDMLGLRTVTLATEPAGARIVIVPIDEMTGEPIAAKAVHCRRKSPVQEELAPGYYFVVADLPDGRFHEVYRYVPGHQNEVPIRGVQRRWGKLDDGTILWSTVKIPLASITVGMASVYNLPAIVDEVSRPSPDTDPEFYMDCHEFTVREKIRADGDAIQDHLHNRFPVDHALCVSYSDALGFAEKVGKRIPTEREYELAARSSLAMPGSSGPDRTDTVPPIAGLLSGVAEWTSTPGTCSRAGIVSDNQTLRDSQIVRAANRNIIDNSPPEIPICGDPMRRMPVDRNSVKPGLGFRCVRSVKPQF